MAQVTTRGYDLACKLNPYIGSTYGIDQTCSLLHRHARTYDRIQEMWCNDEMSDRATARLEAQEAKLEARIRSLVQDLPQPDDGPWQVQFSGDPRGYTVRLIAPTGREIGLYEGSA